MIRFYSSLIISLLLLSAFSIEGKVKLPLIFSENMVLQREKPIPIWGSANPGEKISISLNKQKKIVDADKDGKWAVKLASEKAGGPFRLYISGENKIEIGNILIGDIWLCSGQSNMEWTLGQSSSAEAELPLAGNEMIRHFKIPRNLAGRPLNEIKESQWEISSPATAREFSGLAYFYAKKLNRELNIPIGIINASWGGTNIETWISRKGFEDNKEFSDIISKMPELSLKELAEAKIAAKIKEIEALQGSKIGSIDLLAFSASMAGYANLPEIEQPGLWENQALGDFDGDIWLMKTFDLSYEESQGRPILELSKIDDSDTTYLNGKAIGSTNSWDSVRRYQVPSGILREGQNTVLVKVKDTGGGGGIYGEASSLRMLFENSSVPLAGKWKFHVVAIKEGVNENEFPSLAFNGMINPVIPYGIRGFLWYQGESNTSRAYQYRKAFPALIKDWRRLWQADLPFYFVQLATFKASGNSNEGSPWAELRESQSLALGLRNTGMAVTIDIGDPGDIHPRDKKTLGERLAAIALEKLFARQTISTGPSFRSFKTLGEKAIISFAGTGSGLASRGGKALECFEAAGKDQVFYAAAAYIEGNKVVVSSENVSYPSAVRYAWIGDASKCNLFNNEGYPAAPFRSDDWKTSTKHVTYKITRVAPF